MLVLKYYSLLSLAACDSIEKQWRYVQHECLTSWLICTQNFDDCMYGPFWGHAVGSLWNRDICEISI